MSIQNSISGVGISNRSNSSKRLKRWKWLKITASIVAIITGIIAIVPMFFDNKNNSKGENIINNIYQNNTGTVQNNINAKGNTLDGSISSKSNNENQVTRQIEELTNNQLADNQKSPSNKVEKTGKKSSRKIKNLKTKETEKNSEESPLIIENNHVGGNQAIFNKSDLSNSEIIIGNKSNKKDTGK